MSHSKGRHSQLPQKVGPVGRFVYPVIPVPRKWWVVLDSGFRVSQDQPCTHGQGGHCLSKEPCTHGQGGHCPSAVVPMSIDNLLAKGTKRPECFIKVLEKCTKGTIFGVCRPVVCWLYKLVKSFRFSSGTSSQIYVDRIFSSSVYRAKGASKSWWLGIG